MDERVIVDISIHKMIALMILNIAEILQISGVGQGINIHNHGIRGVQKKSNQVRSYKSCTACY
jgi:hypothetical protein